MYLKYQHLLLMAEEPLIKDLACKAQESSSTEFHLDHIYANCIDVHPIKKTSFHSEYWNRGVCVCVCVCVFFIAWHSYSEMITRLSTGEFWNQDPILSVSRILTKSKYSAKRKSLNPHLRKSLNFSSGNCPLKCTPRKYKTKGHPNVNPPDKTFLVSCYLGR